MIAAVVICVLLVQYNSGQELLVPEAEVPSLESGRERRDASDQPVSSQAERPSTQDDFARIRREKTMDDGENQQRTTRMLLQDSNVVQEGFREPRGAIKEQWTKHPYPVRSMMPTDDFDDNIAAGTNIKAPRVHFVTQRRLESAPPPVYRSYEREGRSRDLHREVAPRPPSRVEYYPLERPVKRPFNPYRDDAYYRYEESRYDPRYGSFEKERPRSDFPTRQRRIIYYATLPEVVRTPPNVNLRNRYVYRDRYDDRYLGAPSQADVDESSYRFRKPSPYTKPRYEPEMERTKAPYPLKVSTDVNVRETKKNPERRIYSEPESRYAYKSQPYQSKESFDQHS